MADGVVGLHITGRTANEIVDAIVRAEAEGVRAAWSACSPAKASAKGSPCALSVMSLPRPRLGLSLAVTKE